MRGRRYSNGDEETEERDNKRPIEMKRTAGTQCNLSSAGVKGLSISFLFDDLEMKPTDGTGWLEKKREKDEKSEERMG